MGVENEDVNHNLGEQSTVPPQDHLVQPLAAEQAAGQHAAEGPGTVPVTVVSRTELEELQAKADQLEKRRASDRERSKRWYHSDPAHARALSQARTQAWRERRRQASR
jgi:hypothetical protein